MTSRPRLYVFVRAPMLGAVKRRLAAGLGEVAALRFYRAATERLLRRLVRDQRWETILAVTPDGAARGASPWPPGLARVGQGGGDLGARMGRVLAGSEAVPVAIVGSDIPDLRAPPYPRCLCGAARRRPGLRPGRGWRVLAGRAASRPLHAGPVRWGSLVEPACARRHARQPAVGKTGGDARGARGYRRRRRLCPLAAQAELSVRCSLSRGISSTKLQGLCRMSSW